MDKAAAIVTTQESIQQKLTALDLNILAILKQLRLVEKQKNQGNFKNPITGKSFVKFNNHYYLRMDNILNFNNENLDTKIK